MLLFGLFSMAQLLLQVHGLLFATIQLLGFVTVALAHLGRLTLMIEIGPDKW
ncbi:hypothetical protein SPHV1_560029 [Novosphingobium sp. KN65.2]|nr:hypothetical protein SPHV1_560029 [Novosphingobium sp. KN65.2]